MSNASVLEADIERAVKKELGVVLGYCLFREQKKYAPPAIFISAATTLIASFVEPECGVDDVRMIVHDKCLAIGVSLADIQSAIDSDTVDRSLSENEAISRYIEQLGDDSSF